MAISYNLYMEHGFTNIRSLLGALAEAMNLINPEVQNHHQKTAYLAYIIAKNAGYSQRELESVIYASLLHDIGSVIYDNQGTIEEIEREAELISLLGAKMLYGLEGFDDITEIISFCQLSWQRLLRRLDSLDAIDGDRAHTEKLMRLASIIHIADTISVIADTNQPILNQVKNIVCIADSMRGTEFSEEAADTFKMISENEFIWFDLMFRPAILLLFTGEIRRVSLEETVSLTQLMSRIIDYRSSFTAMHSAGVAASAMKLGELTGMTRTECMMMKIAGNLHDIGKLKVPRSILEKNGRLTDEEFNIIKEHPYFTRLILMGVDGFGKIADWAGFHHEKLNGRGYPFGFGADELDLGSRIMAVADIFSAITEVRPYRDGMPKEQAIKVMCENVSSGAICGDITALLLDHYDEVDEARCSASREAGKRYFESLKQR